MRTKSNAVAEMRLLDKYKDMIFRDTDGDAEEPMDEFRVITGLEWKPRPTKAPFVSALTYWTLKI